MQLIAPTTYGDERGPHRKSDTGRSGGKKYQSGERFAHSESSVPGAAPRFTAMLELGLYLRAVWTASVSVHFIVASC